jgi:hypothetical protein
MNVLWERFLKIFASVNRNPGSSKQERKTLLKRISVIFLVTLFFTSGDALANGALKKFSKCETKVIPSSLKQIKNDKELGIQIGKNRTILTWTKKSNAPFTELILSWNSSLLEFVAAEKRPLFIFGKSKTSLLVSLAQTRSMGTSPADDFFKQPRSFCTSKARSNRNAARTTWISISNKNCCKKWCQY